MGNYIWPPNRAAILTLTITNTNIEELNHLDEYASLQTLRVYETNLISIPTLPDTIKHLYYVFNGNLSQLSDLPNALRSLTCNDNSLTQLPALPDTLQYLHCARNQLTRLPELPSTLTLLICSYNNLTQLPVLPDTLQTFACHKNPFELDIYNQSLEEIRQWQRENPPHYEPILK